jgi:hypothetical protein
MYICVCTYTYIYPISVRECSRCCCDARVRSSSPPPLRCRFSETVGIRCRRRRRSLASPALLARAAFFRRIRTTSTGRMRGRIAGRDMLRTRRRYDNTECTRVNRAAAFALDGRRHCRRRESCVRAHTHTTVADSVKVRRHRVRKLGEIYCIFSRANARPCVSLCVSDGTAGTAESYRSSLFLSSSSLRSQGCSCVLWLWRKKERERERERGRKGNVRKPP